MANADLSNSTTRDADDPLRRARPSLVTRAWRRLLFAANTTILGVHPNNTCFSFNWHSIRHLRAWMSRSAARLPAGGLTIADVGGGVSPYYPTFANRAARYVTVDVAASHPAVETRPIERLVGVMEDIPLGDESCDVVICNQVLEHVVDPARSVAEASRILKPQGWFIGSVPQMDPVHLEPYDFRRFTTYGVQAALSDAGFVDIEICPNDGAFAGAAFLLAMDWVNSRHQAGRSMVISQLRSLLLAPLIGAMNLLACAADSVLGRSGRCPTNICWLARKPKTPNPRFPDPQSASETAS